MSRGFWTKINESLNEKGILYEKKAKAISNLSVIAGIVIIIVFFIVYMFFI
ncbi:hypothetical protein [Alkaliphilus serpentinus]|uniref:hypothetical protein n=1 Tax=Alkaliphilus serpentinus TaxID=1482731 RepID=UPI00186576B3|nr:hypothetical protein [Alkaliphilus serpentinus]